MKYNMGKAFFGIGLMNGLFAGVYLFKENSLGFMVSLILASFLFIISGFESD